MAVVPLATHAVEDLLRYSDGLLFPDVRIRFDETARQAAAMSR